jgi:hypothetical protein
MRFTLSDLVVGGFVVLLVVAVTPGVLRNAQDARGRAECGLSLRDIGQAIFNYQQDFGGFPRGEVAASEPVTAFSGAAPGQTPKANDTSLPFMLLVKYAGLDNTRLVCFQAAADGMAERRIPPPDFGDWPNLPSRIWLTYSLANPYVQDHPPRMGVSRGKMAVVAADLNPGGTEVQDVALTSDLRELSRVNSPNHRREGQNVLYADGRVDFAGSPFAGVDRDNIYASRGTFPIPADADDAVLLPLWTDGPQLAPAYTIQRKWVFYGFATLGLLGFAVLLAVNKLRARPVGVG